MGYPPFSTSSYGVVSLIGGLKFGLFSVAIIGIILFITGVYRYTLMIAGGHCSWLRRYSGCIFLIICRNATFGQLPSIVGVRY
jgi:hypothetical protein